MAVVYFVSEDGSEHELGSVGEYSIGRGPLLKVTDKRISRNHITVKIDDTGNVLMCPKHTNPCYHKQVGTHKFIQLKQGVWQQLSHNDQISLLHYDIKELIFTVKMKSSDVDIEQNVRTDIGAIISTIPTTNPEEVDSSTVISKPVKPEPKTSLSGLDISNDNTSTATQSNSTATSLESKPVSSTGKTRILPGWLKTMTTNTSSTAEEKPILKKRTTSPPPVKKNTSSSAKPELTTKRRRSSDDDKDNDIVKEKPVPKKRVSPPSMDTATIEDNTLSAHPKKETKKEESPSKNSDEIVKTKKLPLCPYGKKCYRKNPDHFKEYSHERASSDDEDKPECPYGTSCYRRNPLHHQQYKHTTSPGATTTGRKRTQTRTRPKREKKAKKSVVVGDSDDDGEANTYDYNDSFIDDEDVEGSSSTSYGPDSEEDEDWAPVESSEDVQELVADANNFMSNKKMHKTV